MKRKILIYGMLLTSLLLVAGCGKKDRSLETDSGLVEIMELEEGGGQAGEIEPISLSDQEIKEFFDHYLTLDQASILALNQKPKKIDEAYWQAYQAYEQKTNEILGSYLSVQAKNKLGKQYLHDDFHYPRFLEINDYMITGFSQVEEASIISKDVKGDHHIYEVMVTAIANVMNLDQAHNHYQWDDDKGYYIASEGPDLGYEPGSDRIKVSLKYLLEIEPGDGFLLESVKEATGIYLGIHQQNHPSNNSFVARLPYDDQVKEQDKEKIYQFLDSFMKQDYNFYEYYRKAYETGYEMFDNALATDLSLRNVIKLTDDYRTHFTPYIIPLKDHMASLDFNVLEDVTVEKHLSSTERLSAYQVNVAAEASLLDGRVVDYEYTYIFTFEDDRILSVKFINQEECLEETI